MQKIFNKLLLLKEKRKKLLIFRLFCIGWNPLERSGAIYANLTKGKTADYPNKCKGIRFGFDGGKGR